MDIVALLHCLQPCLTATSLRHLTHIVLALLTMTGRITMTGIARWTGKGASSRTVQRFFASSLPWPNIFWLLFRHHHFRLFRTFGDPRLGRLRTYGDDVSLFFLT